MNDKMKHQTAVGASGIRNIVMGVCGLLAVCNVIPDTEVDTIVPLVIMILTPLYSMYAKNKALKADPPKPKGK